MNDDTYIVIAAYNEEKNIVSVIKDLKKAGYSKIVVVDDGSKDHTFQNTYESGVYALHHKVNRGQGAALKTGIDFAVKQRAKYIVTFDADGQHQTKDLPAMLEPVRKGIADISLGSRFLKRTDIPFTRKVLLKGSIFVIWLFYGVKMTDAHNGFRVFSRDAAKKIRIRSDRMEHASEIIEQIKKNKLRFVEVPVTIKYTQYSLQHGQGSFLQAIKVLFRMILNKFLD